MAKNPPSLSLFIKVGIGLLILAAGIAILFFMLFNNKKTLTKENILQTKPALLQVLSTIHTDGTIDKQTALEAYQLVFGDMPGVTVPQGAQMKLGDATGPLRFVEAHFAELSEVQQKALQKRLSLGSTIQKSQAFVPKAYADTTGIQVLQLAQTAEKILEGKLGHPGVSWDIATVDDPNPQEDTYIGYADVADQNNNKTGVPYKCHIYIARSQLTVPLPELTNTIDHEMFHCFQAAAYASIDQFEKAPSWLLEGSAEWVGDTLAQISDQKWWKVYLTEPETPLFQRTYDALGFYAHMKETGEYPWIHFDDMFTRQQNSGSLAAADAGLGTHATDFFNSWATGFVRDASLGPEWNTEGPGITTDKMNPAQITITPTDSGGEKLSGLSNSTYDLDIESDVAIFNTPAYTKLHDFQSNGFSVSQPFGAYCTKAGGCVCPAGSAHEGEILSAIPGATPLVLAVTGGRTGSEWYVQGQTLDTYCKSSLVDQCLVGTWVEQTMEPPLDTKGLFAFHDPIGLAYTFAKSGEYTVDFSSLSPIVTKTNATITFTGTAHGKLTASHGAAHQTASTDFSAVTESLSSDGIHFPPINVGAAFSGFGLGQPGTTTQYLCQGNTMTITSSDRKFTFVKK